MSSGGRSNVQVVTGTVEGNDSIYLDIECPFEPDIAYIRHVVPFTSYTIRIAGGVIAVKNVGDAQYQLPANSQNAVAYAGNIITNGSYSAPYGANQSYSNGTFKFAAAGSRNFSSDATYEYCFIKYT